MDVDNTWSKMPGKNDTYSKALSLNCGRQLGMGNNLHLRSKSYTSPETSAEILLLGISGMCSHSMNLDMLNVRLEVSHGVCRREYARFVKGGARGHQVMFCSQAASQISH